MAEQQDSRMYVDYHEVLFCLTAIDKTYDEEVGNFDSRLQHILEKALSMLTECDTKFIMADNEDKHESPDIRYQYVRAIVCVLQHVKVSETVDNESQFSVKQFRTLKVAVELITVIGIIPGLLPGVGIDMAELCPRASHICKEKLTELQKYKRLQFTVQSLTKLYNEIMFRPIILGQVGVLLAGLLQLSHAPLMKPSKEFTLIVQENTDKNKFNMTMELYNTLKKDQEAFTDVLHHLLKNCPMSASMKELMVILGVKGAPKWLQRETRKYLIEQIMQPNGVVSIIAAVCDDILDLGEHWNKLDTISRLIATSHGSNPDKYYRAICPQLLDLLSSNRVKHSSMIGTCCISALYEYNHDVCHKYIIEVICDPLLVNSRDEHVIKNEIEVEKCIENLLKCFVTVEAKFKHMPCKILMKVAVPLFSLYNSIRQSPCTLKSKVKQLMLHLLQEESLRDNLFVAFLGHKSTEDFGQSLATRFGSTGGVEILGIDESLKYEDCADCLFDLISTTNVLSTALFSYLLKFLSNSMKSDYEKGTQNLLVTEDDVIDKMEKQLAAIKMLSNLANISAVQETQLEKPEPLFSFIKTLFNEYIKKRQNSSEDDCEILYVSLMLIKMILSERKKPLNWTVFNDFVKFLKECCTVSNIPAQLTLLMQELIQFIETQGRSEQKHYQDLSVDCKVSSKFEEAIKDLADPLLPVRAHGLLILTKLIEQRDPSTIARKAIVLELFKENVKHDDSFIYLTAINGLCALATSYPEIIIEILVQEFVDMPQHASIGEITVETRIKVGEILVKITRNLGEMAPRYKNILINGFLCSTRDSDSLVRASSLSCLGELCKVLGFRLGDIVIEVIYCISCIIKTDKAPECRRAAVMVSTLLLRGLGKDTLTSFGKDLVELYRGLKHLRDNDDDPVLRLHAQLALEELDYIVQDFLFSPPKLEKTVFLLGAS